MHIPQVSNIFIEYLSFKCPQKIFATKFIKFVDIPTQVKNASSLRAGYPEPIFL